MTRRRGKPSPVRWRDYELTAEAMNRIPRYDAIGTADGCEFNPYAALHALEFITGKCCFAMGKWVGKPLELLDWQVPLVANLFGWIRPEDGTRRYRRFGLWIPKKNGKTEIAAAIALYLGMADDEPTPRIFPFSSQKEQATELFTRASLMVQCSPELAARTTVLKDRLVWPDSFGLMHPLTSAGKGSKGSKHGSSPSVAIADELHAIVNRNTWDAMELGFSARSQPLMVSLTTKGIDLDSLEAVEHDYCSRICDGTIKNREVLPVIYEAPDDADWQDPRTWALANPSMGVSVNEAELAVQCKKAIDQPSSETGFRTFRINQRPRVTSRWIPLAAWHYCGADPFDDAELRRLPCFLGMDFGQVSDLTSLTAIWLAPNRIYVRSWSYAPQACINPRWTEKKAPYPDFVKCGALLPTDGVATDYGFIEAEVLRLWKRYRVAKVGYDPNNASGSVGTLERKGVQLVRVPQSFERMGPAAKRWETSVLQGQLRHERNPLLTWAMSNVELKNNPRGDYIPSKEKSREKIDPITAGVIALSVALGAGPIRMPDGGSGIRWL